MKKALLTLIALTCCSVAFAQHYPARTVKITYVNNSSSSLKVVLWGQTNIASCIDEVTPNSFILNPKDSKTVSITKNDSEHVSPVGRPDEHCYYWQAHLYPRVSVVGDASYNMEHLQFDTPSTAYFMLDPRSAAPEGGLSTVATSLTTAQNSTTATSFTVTYTDKPLS